MGPEPVWTFWRREESVASTGIRTCDHQAGTDCAVLANLCGGRFIAVEAYIQRCKFWRRLLLGILHLFYFHSCTVHLDAIKSFILSN